MIRLAVQGTLLRDSTPIRIADGPVMTFELGSGRAEFWEAAAEGMQVGGRRRVLVSPSATLQPLKRGVEARSVIPDGETGRFELELVGMQSGLQARLVRSGVAGVGRSAVAPLLAYVLSWLALFPDALLGPGFQVPWAKLLEMPTRTPTEAVMPWL